MTGDVKHCLNLNVVVKGFKGVNHSLPFSETLSDIYIYCTVHAALYPYSVTTSEKWQESDRERDRHSQWILAVNQPNVQSTPGTCMIGKKKT